MGSRRSRPGPANLAARLDWQQRAASIGAYRELAGYGHPAEPIGPEPVTAAPDIRAAWHEALAALGPAGGPGVRGLSDYIKVGRRRLITRRNLEEFLDIAPEPVTYPAGRAGS
jgi:hypothetical protein